MVATKPCAVHKLVADALLIAGGKALLVRYKDTAPYDGQAGWFIPDDCLHHAEHPLDGAKRILREQVGLEAPDLSLGDVESFGNGAWHLIFHYVGKLEAAPKTQQGANVKEAKWFGLRRLPPADEVSHHGWVLDVIAKLHAR